MKKTVGLVIIMLGLVGRSWATKAVAEIKGTADGSSIKGIVNLEDTPDGLKVSAKLTGVPPGPHGFHIHEFGSCAELGKAAGGHYNPNGTMHGDVLKDGPRHAHVGDMGNITANAGGEATLEAILHDVTLAGGKNTVAGRAIILHEKVDDFSQPTGNAGGRIGCGPIVITAN